MNHPRSPWKIALVLLFVLIGANQAFGQASSVSGTVFDPQGNVVAGAAITATNVASGVTRTTSSTKEGTFQLSQLSPGTYKIRTEDQLRSSHLGALRKAEMNTALSLIRVMQMEISEGNRI